MHQVFGMTQVSGMNRLAWNALKTPRFGSGEQEHSGNLMPQERGESSGWLDKIKTTQLSARKENYDALDRYTVPAPALKEGKRLLALKNSSRETYEEALDKLSTAAEQSASLTHKAHAFRHAAIAAKLAGRSREEARELHRQGVLLRRKADGDYARIEPRNVPEGDFQAMDQEANFTANRIAQPIKNVVGQLAGAATRVLCAGGAVFGLIQDVEASRVSDAMDFAEKKVDHFVKYVASPFEKKRTQACASLAEDYQALEGESSDEEWIDGHDRKAQGQSTGKGLRHPYV